jgi:hypothetical protein
VAVELAVIKHVADNIDPDVWASLDDDEKINRIEILSPMAVGMGLHHDDVTKYMAGDDGQDVVDEVMHENADRVDDALGQIVELMKSADLVEISKGGNPHLLAHIKGVTLLAKVDASNDGEVRVNTIVVSRDVEKELYKESFQYRTKKSMNLDRIEWYNNVASGENNTDMDDIEDDELV